MKFKIPFTNKGVNMNIDEMTTEEVNFQAVQRKRVQSAVEQVQSYKKGSEKLEARVIENEQWYKSRHWEYIRQAKFANDPEPVTPFLLSAINNKHADAMDFYPSANALPREEDDQEEAQRLSKILPVELEYNDFRSTWDLGWWEKLKHGCAVYAVLFDPNGADGIGSGVIKLVDQLNIIYQAGINDIEDSGAVFVYRVITKEQFKDEYPEADIDKAEKVFEPKKYITDDSVDYSEMIVVFDKYYKVRNAEGKKVLHLLQFAGEEHLYCSEDDEAFVDKGLYTHGKYPFFFDTLFPEKNNIRGFGLIDIAKSPQLYIDKLDQLISRNAFTTGRKRHMVSNSISLNTDEFLDVSQDLIHFDGILDDTKFRELTTDSIAADISNHRTQKIEEMEKVTATNEFSRGESASGVTAASAIIALQKASGKVSRDMIQASYNVFNKMMYCYTDIIREFYDVPRPYRIKDDQGNDQFITYDNKGLTEQQLPPVMGIEEEPAYRKPVFDIKIVPERQDPFSQAAHNELAKELFGLGVFNPETYMASKIVMEMMQFEGKEKVVKMMAENDQIMQQLQLMQQMAVENEKLKAIVQQLTGQDLGVNMEGVAQNGQGSNN